jgi:hypothetical protein
MLESEPARCLQASLVRPLISAAPKECAHCAAPRDHRRPHLLRVVAAGVTARFAADTTRVTYGPRSHGGSETVEPDPAHNLTLYARRVLMLEREAAPCLRASVVRAWTNTLSERAPALLVPQPEIIHDGTCSAWLHDDVATRFAAGTTRVTYGPRSPGGSETVQPDPAHNLTLYARRVLMFESEAAPWLRVSVVRP